MKFYRCEHCGNLVVKFVDSGVALTCCGDEMKELTPKTADSATEKHVPVVKVDGAKVSVHVGSVDHPMTEEHSIQWILVETTKGFQKKDLKPGEAPHAEFVLAEGEEYVAAYEFCNLHGLWKA